MLRPALAASHRGVNSSTAYSSHPVDNHDTNECERLVPRKQSKSAAFQSFLSNQWLLCSQLPILILIVVASLDNADKQLLASSFPILEKALHWNIQQLGYFSLCTNLSYALSLPMWGWLIHHPNNDHISHGSSKASSSAKVHLQKLLAYACTAWGWATIGIVIVTSPPVALLSLSRFFGLSSQHNTVSWVLQVVVRCINGMALGSILPLSQSLLAEYTPIHLRGQAFGLMGVGEKFAGTLSSSSVVYLGERYWQYAYYGLGIASIGIGILSSRITLSQPPIEYRKEYDSTYIETGIDDAKGNVPCDDDDDNHNDGRDGSDLSLRQIVERIVRLPAFICLVAQGVFGGTPWDMMSFLLLLMDWRGFSKDQIVMIQFSSGISSMLGGWLGGIMGDYAAIAFGRRDGHDGATNNSSQGRILLALVSVVGGIPLYGLFLYSTDFSWALLWINLFSVWATWTPPGAIRPICADLTRGPSERAQIVALWIALEKVSGAVFGAPLVGYLTDRMLAKGHTLGHDPNDTIGVSNDEKARALAFNLLILSSLFWGICAFFWFVMFLTIGGSRRSRSVLRTKDSRREHSSNTRISPGSHQRKEELGHLGV
jgi:hypothetical protein